MSKYRNFTFVVYPEGLSDNFLDVLSKNGAKGFYILHDLDVLEDGTQKPAHYHFLIMFENQRHLNSVRKICAKCGAANGYVEPVVSLSGCARYLCHMDNPTKHQYETCEVTSFGGADYVELCETKSDRKSKRMQILCQMIGYIKENRIYSYANFMEYCCSHREDWLDCLLVQPVGRSIIEYIKSKSWTDNNIA